MVSEIAKELREKATSLQEEAYDLFEQAKEGERLDKINKEAEDAAFHLAALKFALVDKGFTDDQAFEIIKTVIAQGGKN